MTITADPCIFMPTRIAIACQANETTRNEFPAGARPNGKTPLAHLLVTNIRTITNIAPQSKICVTIPTSCQRVLTTPVAAGAPLDVFRAALQRQKGLAVTRTAPKRMFITPGLLASKRSLASAHERPTLAHVARSACCAQSLFKNFWVNATTAPQGIVATKSA